MNVPPEILEIRRCHIDEAIEASRALQAGLITVGERDSILDLTIDWRKFINQLYRMEAHG